MRGDVGALWPLRALWSGICRVAGGEGVQPDEHALRECCNMGYARGRCARFPANAVPDAVRFAVNRDAGDRIVVSFVIEGNHLPHEQGVVEYSRETRALAAVRPGGLLEPQARAYLASYLRCSAGA